MAQAGPRPANAGLRCDSLRSRGVADAGFLDRLESFRSALHWVGVPIRVPSAWFFDASGRLAAVTEGGFDRAQWTDMLAEAAQPAERWLERALPFPGRTYGPVAGSPSPMSRNTCSKTRRSTSQPSIWQATIPRSTPNSGPAQRRGIRARSTPGR